MNCPKTFGSTLRRWAYATDLSPEIDMRLPNREDAQIDKRKLIDYLLNRNHPDAKGKSAFFWGRYGNDWRALRDALLKHTEGPVVDTRETRHGRLYVIEDDMQRTPVRSVWMIRTGEPYPRLVTAYPIG